MPLPSPATRPSVSHSFSICLAASPADRASDGCARRTCTTPLYTRSFPCTCIRIFSRSSGATAVRDLPHHTPDKRWPQVARPFQQRPHSSDCAAARKCELQGFPGAVAAWDGMLV